MADKLAIINIALEALGQDIVLTLSEDDVALKSCLLHYDLIRRGLLGQYPYDFALREKAYPLVKLFLSGVKISGYAFQYEKPAECLTVWGIWNPASQQMDDKIRFKAQGNYIATDQPDAVAIHSADVDGETLSDAFAMGLAYMLAATCCKPITGNEKLIPGLQDLAAYWLQQAQNQSAQQEHEDPSAVMGRRFIDLP